MPDDNLSPELRHNFLARTSAIGIVDERTGLPSWAVDDEPAVKKAGEEAIRIFNARSELEAAVDKILGNDDLSVDGRKREIARRAQTFYVTEIQVAEAALRALQSVIATAQAALTVPAPAGDPVVAAIRATEIRGEVRGLDQLMVDAAALELAQAGDGEALHALLNPPGRRLVSQEGAARATEVYLGAAKADALMRVKRLEGAARQLAALVASATERAAQLGSESADRTKQIAAGSAGAFNPNTAA